MFTLRGWQMYLCLPLHRAGALLGNHMDGATRCSYSTARPLCDLISAEVLVAHACESIGRALNITLIRFPYVTLFTGYC